MASYLNSCSQTSSPTKQRRFIDEEKEIYVSGGRGTSHATSCGNRFVLMLENFLSIVVCNYCSFSCAIKQGNLHAKYVK